MIDNDFYKGMFVQVSALSGLEVRETRRYRDFAQFGDECESE